MEKNCVGYLLWIRLTKIGYFQEKTTSAFFSPCDLGALRDLEVADEVSLPADSDPQIRQRIKNGRSVRRIVIIQTLDACTRMRSPTGSSRPMSDQARRRSDKPSEPIVSELPKVF
jgi:hypothetical protein